VEPVVGIVMGSSSDLEIMNDACTVLDEFGVSYELHVVSAHRTPEDMIEYGRSAKQRGLRVLMPVVGVPVALARLDGLDSLLSIVQMPRGVPVATVAINGAANAALLSLRILALQDPKLSEALESHRLQLAETAKAQDQQLPRK